MDSKNPTENPEINSIDSRRTWKIISVILFLVLLNVLAFGWPSISVRFSENNIFKSYPLIDKARSYTDQEHFIVNIQPLRDRLREIVADNGPDSISLYFEFLNTGANISINPELKIWPASLAKLPLAMDVMKKIEAGSWGLDTKLKISEMDRNELSGSLFLNPTGTEFTVEELLKEMLISSDNTAFGIFSHNMTEEERRRIIEETGLEDLFNEDGKVGSKEYSRLLRVLYTSSFLERESSSFILELLAESDFDQYLSKGLDEGVYFSNKYGKNINLHVYSDSGIVYVPDRPYILTVMVEGDRTPEEEKKVKALMKEISSEAYVYISNFGKDVPASN